MILRLILYLFILSSLQNVYAVSGLKRRKSKKPKSGIKQRVKSVQKKRLHLPSKKKVLQQKKNPSFDLESSQDQKSTSSIVKIDDKLSIKFPSIKKE
ncbi:hypothetical protein MJH12_07980 [bacterium]|nr:hypothetical protein [bacterium]